MEFIRFVASTLLSERTGFRALSVVEGRLTQLARDSLAINDECARL